MKEDEIRVMFWISLGAVVSVLIGMIIGLAINLHRAEQGDLNHDGEVNTQDLSIMAAHWSK